MKKSFQIALLCAVMILSCLLVSCKTPTLKQEDGGFLNPQTGVSYYPTSPNYFAKPSGDTAYARIKVKGGGEDILLFEIEGIDPEYYLADSGHSIYAAVRGPVETKINFIQKHGISVDTPNHSLSLLMPKNEHTLEYFKRYNNKNANQTKDMLNSR